MPEISFILVVIVMALSFSSLIISLSCFSLLIKISERIGVGAQAKAESKKRAHRTKIKSRIRTPCDNQGDATVKLSNNKPCIDVVKEAVYPVAFPFVEFSRPAVSPMVRHVSEIPNAINILLKDRATHEKQDIDRKTKITRHPSGRVEGATKRGFFDS